MITKRQFLSLGGAAIAMPFIHTGARASNIRLKWGHSIARSHPLTVRGKEAAKKIRELSGGRIAIEIFSDGQLGSDNDQISQVRSGALEMYTPGGSTIGQLVPMAGLINVGFAFDSADAGWKAMDGKIGKIIAGKYEEVGLHMFPTMWALGFRQFTTSAKPINAPADLRGLKIRVPLSPAIFSLIESLSASPVMMNIAETYSSLQTRVVDGQENPLSIISTKRFDEVQKYCSLTDHVWDAFMIVMNKQIFESIPTEFQDMMAATFLEYGLLQRKDIDNLEASYKADLQKKGMVFNAPDKAPFRTALKNAGYYKGLEKTYGEGVWKTFLEYSPSLAA